METLDLRSTGISKLPSSLPSLVSLQTLYLDHCAFDPLTDISLVGYLKKLVILSLQGCNLEQLPTQIGKLTGLKSLNLSHNKALQVPPNVISRLCQLEDLYMKDSFTGWEIEGWKSEMKASLEELTSLLTKVETLQVKKSNELKSVAQTVPTHVGFKNMKSLGIEECHGMEFLMRVQEAVDARNAFSAMEDLVISSMDNLEQLFDGPVPIGASTVGGTQDSVLSQDGETNCTRGRHELKHLPKLTDLHQGSTSLECPRLQHLEIILCDNLKRICLSHETTPKLEKIVGNDEAWLHSIEWKNPGDKQHMRGLFSELSNEPK
ncbi:hypothetical protein MKW94_024716 [Papaver nudicaule]|uniref:Disease resistance R13L4/SHOC-2-like LRR domain-containing protein n=1 Tax=Papaver nudicaule TaxID=74823 RepID=A0AA41SJ08_PAPNU|nr:hypothetical protein [Papaver nudicaule]